MIEALEKSKKPMTVPEADFSAVNEWVQLDGRDYVVIRGLESLDPFFLSLVSASEQWFFCSSNGSLSAGRRSPDTALFPYLTVDKILDNWNCSGALTAISCEGHLWHPFWPVATHFAPVKRRLLKSLLGEELIFEERHDALGLVFSYRWQLSDEFGFVRKVELINEGDETRSLRMIDGLQDLLPSGVNHGLHLELSCLADAYKMSELVCGGALMIHRLASGIVDAPIPLECLKVTTVWTSGFEGGHTFLSRTEAENYLKRGQVTGGQKSRGQRGAFLLGGEMTLAAGESRKWTMVAEIEQSHQAVAKLATQLEDPVSLLAAVENDLRKERERLYALVASVDGFQVTADRDVAHYHYHNTLCNYLRGGLPEDHAKLGRESFIHYLAQNNRPLLEKHQDALESLPVSVQRADLIDWAAQQGSLSELGGTRLDLPRLPRRFYQ